MTSQKTTVETTLGDFYDLVSVVCGHCPSDDFMRILARSLIRGLTGNRATRLRITVEEVDEDA